MMPVSVAALIGDRARANRLVTLRPSMPIRSQVIGKCTSHGAQDDDGGGGTWIHVPQGSLAESRRASFCSDHRAR